MSKKFRWAVTPLTRRHSVPAALLAPRLKSTKTITMPERNLRMLSDAECGLPEDPIAQQRAEEAIRAAIGYRLREEAKAKPAVIQAVEIPIADDALSIRDVPADVLEGIAVELRRIAGLPARL